jgi:hypothetical protein
VPRLDAAGQSSVAAARLEHDVGLHGGDLVGLAGQQGLGGTECTGVGGISRRPRAIGDHVEVRDVLDLTLTIDHNVVDGSPATRFAADLRQVLHTAAVLPEASASDASLVNKPSSIGHSG